MERLTGKGMSTLLTSEIYKRLMEYEDEEEHGLLLRLPCKVGDTVYAIIPSPFGKSWVAKGEITRFGYWGDGLACTVTYKHFGECNMLGWFGDDVFLTREEAEAALKGE